MEYLLLGIIFLLSYVCFGHLSMALIIVGIIRLALFLDDLYLKHRRR